MVLHVVTSVSEERVASIRSVTSTRLHGVTTQIIIQVFTTDKTSNHIGLLKHVARREVKRNTYKILILKPEGKRPFGSPRRRWEDNIK
jgi:hypothetical protein